MGANLTANPFGTFEFEGKGRLYTLLLLLYFRRHMQPIGYGVAIYIVGLKHLVVLMSLQFLIKHSVEVLLLFSSESPC